MSEINKVKVNGVEYDLPSGSGSGAVSSVNGKTGAVQLAASDVGARPDTWTPTATQVGAVPSSYQSAINSNTSARHSHSNKTVLDGITASKVAQWDAAGAGYVAQDDPPEDTDVLWVDTSDDTGGGGVGASAGRNLLDNPWFTVNQRGATSWTSGYGVDRWKVINGTATVTDDGLTVNGTIRQILEKAPDGDVVASVRMSSGTAEITYDSSNNYVDIVSNGGTVRAAKLEYGTSSTIATDHEPEYAHELLKCQRFFYRLNDYRFPILAWNTLKTTASMTITTPVAMRIAAPIVAWEQVVICNAPDGTARTLTTLREILNGAIDNYYTLRLEATAAWTKGTGVIVLGGLTLDADL